MFLVVVERDILVLERRVKRYVFLEVFLAVIFIMEEQRGYQANVETFFIYAKADARPGDHYL